MSNPDIEPPVTIVTPFTAMQAAEFERDDFGCLSIECGDVAYKDFASGLVLLRVSCGNATAARKFLRATRRAARAVVARRAAFALVPDTGSRLRPPAPPRLRASAPRAHAGA